jgi:hypothetical protein
MDRTIKIWVLAVSLAFIPLAIASAGPPDAGEQTPAAVVKTAVDSAPQAVFGEMKYDFTPVFEGTEIKHDFVVENKGDAPLIIDRIKPD